MKKILRNAIVMSGRFMDVWMLHSGISIKCAGITFSPKVLELLSQMTLAEKVGQMTQVTLETLVKPGATPDAIVLSDSAVNRLIVDYKVGSVLNCAGLARTPQEWQSIITKLQDLAMKQTRLGIPIIYGIDAIHGTNYVMGATLFPQQVGLAATWNPTLVQELAAITAYETRTASIPWNFSPVLDLGVDPRWPRIWEGFGEDPHLATEMGVAMVRGYEGDNIADKARVASCLKHFIGYGAPRSGKDRTPAWIPERMMRELFVPPFTAAVQAGARTIMINSGEVNGIPVHLSPALLTDLLRNELGFTGVAVTDWYDIYNLVERHHVAANRKEAIRLAINAGVDMAMVPYEVDFADLLIELAEEGAVPMARIDEAVKRILQLKVDLGLFEQPISDFKEYPDFASQASSQKAYQGAAESITLLKNENNLLPLKKDRQNIAGRAKRQQYACSKWRMVLHLAG